MPFDELQEGNKVWAKQIALRLGRLEGTVEGAIRVLKRLKDCPDGSLKNTTIEKVVERLEQILR